ncbi:hypothetical protein [Soonwooa sp.]|uniref:hypothetical protein n=1 Tax=Soonwooa sp. TaxID=1938592 RepID=UPI00261B2552|nr:hypothetical protein [Soonwooa sp.]
MNGLQEIQDELFLDIQNIIEELNEISSIDDLLQKENLIKELSEKATFLKLSEAFGLNHILQKSQIVPAIVHEEIVKPEEVSQEEIVSEPSFVENATDEEEEEKDDDLDLIDNQILAEAHQEELVEVEDNELHEDIDEEFETQDDHLDLSDNEMFKEDDVEELPEVVDEKLEEPAEFLNKESQFSFAMSHGNESPTEEPKVEEPSLVSEISVSEDKIEDSSTESISHITDTVTEEKLEEPEVIHNVVSEEKSEEKPVEKIVEESQESKFNDRDSDTSEDAQNAKKIKLSNIKGISKTLFDDDPLERIHTTESASEDKNIGSLGRNNMPTDYMEAPKPKPEFRLDLNDKIAFTQHLFKNSQVELNQVIHKLNEFDNLDAAKEFLSDLYYHKNWEKADSYAQRLWTLVENRFV